jgi:hypothetical protein
VALWIARAVCYANAKPIRFWGSLGRPVSRALTDRTGRAAGGAAIEHHSRAMLDIILEAR